ncbi:bile acid:sodium symporter family protein [Reinekea thalattae]|uniref:Bile acid:sodium symporter family protein n=1 Tax=Reinekea thalattae TaxID=2593301 RepID=A0A5C8Z9I5_9GAMM|nr:bile acid:sodium symporter family protein [Reinekea thalattae]TXR54755.1 bile acid:sodium symporter family protein [Reinekea thalattae]
MLNVITMLFPLWAILGSLVAYFQPELLVGYKGQIVPLLMIIMLAMGLTLKLEDFWAVVSNKKALILGVILQFTVMPIVALIISIVLQMDKAVTIGMVLVGSVAGGTASNVICYLARGNVALSISMTATSTLVGVVMTPLLIDLLLGVSVDVPALSMIVSLAKIVLLPVSAGIMLNYFFARYVVRLADVFPFISMVAIVAAISIIVAINQAQIATVGMVVFIGVVLHNAIGCSVGYGVTRLLGFDRTVCKTIAIEVGMQNSGLATALALKFFTPLSALPAAIFSIWHNIAGSIFALVAVWAEKESKS